MERSLPLATAAEPAHACVWVDAGVLTYRLCNRGFACETCPLDAAIRSDPRVVIKDGPEDHRPTHGPWCFPNDRLYADGHLWVQLKSSRHVRVGIDACAARLVPPVEEINTAPHNDSVSRSQPLCTLAFDGGEWPLLAPVTGTLINWNQQAAANPSLIVADPYAAGWIAELVLAAPQELAALRHAGAASELARLTARRLGRQAAFSLLGLTAPEDLWIDPGLLEATRHALGATPYVAMIRDALA